MPGTLDRAIFFGKLERYFERTLAEHGATAKGVDWRSPEAQEARFRQVVKVCEKGDPLSLIDYGCGYGALAHYMLEQGYDITYQGFDINPQMIEIAQTRNRRPDRWAFVSDESELEPADYTIGCGLFSLRLDVDDESWKTYVLETLESLDRLSRRGFSFNMLTKYSDPPLMRPDLYYADPCFYFDHCKRRFSRNVALLHDYDLYEFTIIVRAD
jgi:SAM-dependent methyltransferase